jgi:TolB-like protein
MTEPDIFLSYNREDAGVAKRFADAFAAEGLDVWWDTALRSGEAYDEVTEAALRGAKAVVVLWSPRSVVSRWVRAEATIADRCKTLVPVTIEACERPIMFELTQTAELSHWDGDAGDRAWCAFLSDVRRFVGAAASQPSELRAAAAATPAPQQSIVVLPFANMSGDPEQEYFADGISEDIITDLSKVSALMVISRNSAFTFKGKHVDVVDVARQLNVSHVLEGSVRKAGNRVRVTAQLIDGSSNGHVWAERWDRDLDDIFALQDELSQAIVAALKVKLLPEEKKAIEERGTDNIEAYELFVRARALYTTYDSANALHALAIIRQVTALDPDFALAWCVMAGAMHSAQVYQPEIMLTGRAELDNALAQASRIAPDSPDVIAALMVPAMADYDWATLDLLVGKMQNGGTSAVRQNGHTLLVLGRAKAGADYQLTARQTDPLSTGASFALQYCLDAAGRLDEAEAEYERSNVLHGNPIMTGWRAITRAMARDDHARVRALFTVEFAADTHFMPFRPQLLKVFDQPEEALGVIRAAFADPTYRSPAHMAALANWAVYFGDNDLALAALRHGLVEQRSGVTIGDLWFPNLAPLRRDPRFKQIVRDIGLAAHWRKSGNWGDFARPLGEDDFEMIA